MSQYFENDTRIQDAPGLIHFEINGKTYELNTNAGVFSKDKLDTGTRILLETVLKQEKNPSSVLDLGCGIGVIGLVLASNWDTKLTSIDVNERAVELTKKNLEKYHIYADVYAQSGIVQDEKYECILLNPPIRTGKKMIYSLFDQCIDHLDEKGRFWIVMRKQHGAQSAVDYLEQKGCLVNRVNRDKGYWILKIEKDD